MTLLFVSTLPGVSAAPTPKLTVDYTATVYGDFVMTGNTVTTCPPVPACHDAQNRIGSGPQAQNDAYAMRWVDVDGNPATYNSSSGRLLVPPGAAITYATLTWAGSTAGCGPVRPPLSPARQAVSVSVAGRTSRVPPARFAAGSRSYRAQADLTKALRGAGGPVTIMVGNVWTPEGFGCFGGWSVTVVWSLDRPTPPFALARQHIVVYDANLALGDGVRAVTVTAPSIRPAGGTTRLGVTGYEGDWALAGDRILVNRHDPDGTGGFFTSLAEGRLDPSYLNNMSVDVRTVPVPARVIGAGEASAELSFTTVEDAYLVGGLAMSMPLPELVAVTTVDRASAHEGDPVTQTIRVSNVGGAPAVHLLVRNDLGCGKAIGRLDAGASATVVCARTAAGARPSGEVSGQSLTGEALTARADTALDVLRPALAVRAAASPTTVLAGERVNYEISVGNTGNTALSAVTVGGQVRGCDRVLGRLAAGQTASVRCSTVAGERGLTGTLTATGVDPLGLRVTAGGSAPFTVAHPAVRITVRPSTSAVRPRQPVSIRVTVTNPSAVPLGAVEVTGSPAVCAAHLGTLEPGQSTSYTCDLVVRQRLTVDLSVAATPILAGRPVDSRRDAFRANGFAIVSLVPPNPPLQPPPTPPETPRRGTLPPLPTAALISGLALLANFVVITAIAATAGRPR